LFLKYRQATILVWVLCNQDCNKLQCPSSVRTARKNARTTETVLRLRMSAGDKLDFIVWPKDDHDCDAALLLEAKIWDSSEFKETTTF
jgi:hypothetical protein